MLSALPLTPVTCADVICTKQSFKAFCILLKIIPSFSPLQIFSVCWLSVNLTIVSDISPPSESNLFCFNSVIVFSYSSYATYKILDSDTVICSTSLIISINLRRFSVLSVPVVVTMYCASSPQLSYTYNLSPFSVVTIIPISLK